MPPDKENLDVPDEEYAEFVPAVFARSRAEAEQYRELLNDHDIPAVIRAVAAEADEQPETPLPARGRQMTHGVPVLVPEVLLDEASEVIADREDLDEFQCGEDDEREEEDEEEFGFEPSLDGAQDRDVLQEQEEEEDEFWADEEEEDDDL